MKKTITALSLLFFFSIIQNTYGQITTINTSVIDDLQRFEANNPERRSANNPTTCQIDTIEYARYNQVGGLLQIVTASEGRGLAQFYGAPQELTIYGASFYAYLAYNPPTNLKSKVYVNLYKAGSDSLPSGLPLRSDTIVLDSAFGNGLISNIVKHANFNPINVNFDYIIAVETDPNDTLRMGIVANDWNNNSGKGRSFNAGSINGTWYRGRNLNVGSTPFDADLLINPYVKYNFGTDFIVSDQCVKIGSTVTFKNKSKDNVSSSIFYNRWANLGVEYTSHRWNYDLEGTPFNSYAVVDGQTTFSQSRSYQVRLATQILQWTASRYCYDTTTYTIYPKPETPVIHGSQILCEGDSIELFIKVPDGASARWVKDNQNDTIGYSFAEKLLSYNLNQPTNFYARLSNGVCLSDVGSANVPVYPYPDVPTVTNDSICIGSRATLVATSPGALSMTWYKEASEDKSFHVGSIFQTPNLDSDTFFYVRASNYSCYSKGYVKIEAIVSSDFAPQEPNYYGDTIVCSSTSPIITLSANTPSSNSIRWFDQPNGGTPISTDPMFSFNAPSQRGVYNYFVETWNGSCASSRIIATVEVDNAPEITNYEGSNNCFGEISFVKAKVPYGGINWFDKSSNGRYISSDSIIYFKGVSGDTTLYIETFSKHCFSNSLTPVSAIINTPPDFTLLKGDTICSKSYGVLEAKIPYGSILWYENIEDTIPFAIGNTYKTPVLLGKISYYVSSQYMGCVSNKHQISVTVNERPFSGFFYDVLKNRNVKFTPLQTSGNGYDWNFGDGGIATDISPTHQYNDTGFYDVSLILTSIKNNCRDTTINQIFLPFIDNTSVIEINQQSFKVYPNPSQSYFIIESDEYKEDLSVEIFNMNGQKVFDKRFDFSSENSVKIEHNLSKGVYFISLNNSMWKIVIE